MGLERRLPPASRARVSLDAVLNASSVDLGQEERSPYVTTYPVTDSTPASGGEQTEDRSNTVNATPISVLPSRVRRQTNETFETRSVRSSSSASRHGNRLSLTLPIAPPNSLPSRPAPTCSTPATPIDASVLNSPHDSDDFIIAIAAQERHVLELREELARAEVELKRLQRQWTIAEAYTKRPPNNFIGSSPGLAPAIILKDGAGERPIAKHHSELERRKAILLAQSQGPPRHHKRTIIRGAHTRTLSLLCDRSNGDLSRASDSLDSAHRSPESCYASSPASISYPLNKRATWTVQTTQQPTGVKQLTSFRQGFWTFVEDLRQATIGDEAISGTTHRTSDMGLRSSKTDADQNTIRATTANRGRIPFPTELDSPADSPSKSSASTPSDRFQHKRTASRPEPRTRKHFSWTPLTFENFNEDDWSSWNSQNVKPSRWSGSTVGGDTTPIVPEKDDESESTLRCRSSNAESGQSAAKSNSKPKDVPQTLLDRLSPSNIQSSTSTFMKEWERSLSPPPQTSTFEAGLQDFTRSAQ